MSAGFISEKEIDEKRRKRQEEWEKVRLPDQPLDAPEETHDNRSLFDRLQEQKDKKELEWEEAHKLKNQVRGLDVEEIGFLDYVDNVKIREEKSRMKEEKELLQEFRTAVSSLREKALDERVKEETKKPVIMSLKSLVPKSNLLGVVRKRSAGKDDSRATVRDNTGQCPVSSHIEVLNDSRKKCTVNSISVAQPLLKCVAVLPGIGTYTDSSDSDLDSSGSESDNPPPSKKLDLLGRAFEKHSEGE